jgi:hypothetical protein
MQNGWENETNKRGVGRSRVQLRARSQEKATVKLYPRGGTPMRIALAWRTEFGSVCQRKKNMVDVLCKPSINEQEKESVASPVEKSMPILSAYPPHSTHMQISFLVEAVNPSMVPRLPHINRDA